MAGLEGYHGNEEDVYVKGKKQKPSVYKNTVHETLPDPETENEKPGFDHFEDWNEEYKNKSIDTDLEEEFDHVGDPNDDHLLAIEREELMKKYDDTLGKNNVEDQNDFVADLSDEPTEPKRESIHLEAKRKSGRLGDGRGSKIKYQSLEAKNLVHSRTIRAPMLGRDNLKTMPDIKKQRTFGQRIKAFLLGQNDVEEDVVSKNIENERMLNDMIDYDREKSN